MADYTNYTIVALTATILAILGFALQPEPTHYCDATQTKTFCKSVSGTRCYQTDDKTKNYKLCSSNWQVIPSVIIEQKPADNGVRYECSFNSPCRIK